MFASLLRGEGRAPRSTPTVLHTQGAAAVLRICRAWVRSNREVGVLAHRMGAFLPGVGRRGLGAGWHTAHGVRCATFHKFVDELNLVPLPSQLIVVARGKILEIMRPDSSTGKMIPLYGKLAPFLSGTTRLMVRKARNVSLLLHQQPQILLCVCCK